MENTDTEEIENEQALNTPVEIVVKNITQNAQNN